MVHAAFLTLMPFESLDSLIVLCGESVVDVASPSPRVASMTMYLLVGHLYVDRLVISPHSVGLLFSLTIFNVR